MRARSRGRPRCELRWDPKARIRRSLKRCARCGKVGPKALKGLEKFPQAPCCGSERLHVSNEKETCSVFFSRRCRNCVFMHVSLRCRNVFLNFQGGLKVLCAARLPGRPAREFARAAPACDRRWQSGNDLVPLARRQMGSPLPAESKRCPSTRRIGKRV